MNIRTTEEGRWILGDPFCACPKCGAGAAVKYAGNGRAEFWHPPTDCCDWARGREKRYDAMRRAEEERETRWHAHYEATR